MSKTGFYLLIALSLVACGGGGGGASGSTVVTTPISVVPEPAPVPQPKCSMKIYSNEYPSSYIKTPVPTPQAKFETTIQRMIGLKDYYPNFTNDCVDKVEHSRLLYASTLDKLMGLGVDVVELYQYGPVDDFNNATWTINNGNLQIRPSELEWVVAEAHNRGMKVTLAWQLWAIDTKGNILNTSNPTSDEVISLLRGWKNIITSVAATSAKLKIDNLFVHWHAFYYPALHTTYSEIATQEFLSIISDIRKIYSGKLFMGTPRFFDHRITDKVDAVVIPLMPGRWTEADNAIMSLPMLKNRFLMEVYSHYQDFTNGTGINTSNTPIIWDVGIQSRENALIDLWVEDSFCVSSAGGLIGGTIVDWNADNCMQIKYVTDFGIQALVAEAGFEAIRDQTLFKTYGVKFGSNYWYTDTLVPGPEGFPNLSSSIRGKPAEAITKYWFSRN